MSKQTSIELLEKEYKISGILIKEDFEQAKEMHKQEIIDAAQRWKEPDYAERYYNEIYKSVGVNKMIELPKQNDDVREDDVEKLDFEKELEHLINKHSIENESDTPDFVLSSFLYSCLQSFKYAVKKREILKAKENTYTEEQVDGKLIKAIYLAWGNKNLSSYEIIQSLKNK